VNPVDLIALEVLHVFEFEVYDALSVSKDLLTEAPPDQSLYGKARVGCGSCRHPCTGRTCRLLISDSGAHNSFRISSDQPGWAFQNVSYGMLTISGFAISESGHPDVFDRYFLLSTPMVTSRKAELQRLIAVTGDRESWCASSRRCELAFLLLTAARSPRLVQGSYPLGERRVDGYRAFRRSDDISDERSGEVPLSREA